MKLFDGETIETIYLSIEQITGIGTKSLKSFLQQTDEDEVYDGLSDPDDVLLKKLLPEQNSVLELDGICWFHLTRTVRNNTFAEGLLPLGHALRQIWEFLFSLVQDHISEEEWSSFKQKVEAGHLNHSAYLYESKVSNSRQWGPFATLIRDFAFKANDLPIHDYFRTPEIVEDIAICFEDLYNIDLLHRFSQATVPCVVKFVDYEKRSDVVGTALHYLYVVNHNLEISIFCNTNINKRGQEIPKDRILKVDFPQYP